MVKKRRKTGLFQFVQKMKELTCDNGKADLIDSWSNLHRWQNKKQCYFVLSCQTIWKYLCVSYFSALLNWTQRTDSKKRRWKFPGRISLGYFPNCKKKKCLTWNISCCWQWPRTAEGRCRVWSSWSKSSKPYFLQIWDTLNMWEFILYIQLWMS